MTTPTKTDYVTFVWVFMSEFAEEGARSAPSAIFTSHSRAIAWVKDAGLKGNLYKFPVDLSLTEYADPIFGERKFMRREQEERPKVYKSGKPFLGLIDHEHFFD